MYNKCPFCGKDLIFDECHEGIGEFNCNCLEQYYNIGISIEKLHEFYEVLGEDIFGKLKLYHSNLELKAKLEQLNRENNELKTKIEEIPDKDKIIDEYRKNSKYMWVSFDIGSPKIDQRVLVLTREDKFITVRWCYEFEKEKSNYKRWIIIDRDAI